jgi:asparagine synthase (glutamine-hydrolysing)
MAGIAGIFDLGGKPASQIDLAQMTQMLAHRGPDGENYYVQGPVGIGHTRLSIVDPGKQANQPMANEKGTIWISLDGRIYNFLALRSQLEAKGHSFRSESDGEVVLHAYEEQDLSCLNQLDGIYAFALWDEQRQRLWLVRDPVGVKPLFYALMGETLLFASEIKAILAHPEVAPQIDSEALSLFLSLDYLPAPYTLFHGIRQLLPGEFLTISTDRPHPELESFFSAAPPPAFSGSLEEACGRLNELLEDAVRMRVRGRIAPGSLLSGGLSASATAAFMARTMDETVNTYSVGFQGHPLSELPYARRVSQWLNTNHTERELSIESLAKLLEIIWYTEEPTVDPSLLCLFYLAQLARRDVKVALTGSGGDELFSTHPAFAPFTLSKLKRLIPRKLDSSAPLPLRSLMTLDKSSFSLNGRDGNNSRGAPRAWQRSRSTPVPFSTGLQIDQLINPELRKEWDPDGVQNVYGSYYSNAAGSHSHEQLYQLETRFHIPNDMLVRLDRMGMAHGLEIHMPMLDPTLIAFAASLPLEFKHNHKEQRPIMALAMTRHLPGALIEQDGIGASLPISEWFSGSMFEFTHDLLSHASVAETGFLVPDAVQKLVDDNLSGRADNSAHLWRLLILMVWWKRFIKQDTL